MNRAEAEKLLKHVRGTFRGEDTYLALKLIAIARLRPIEVVSLELAGIRGDSIHVTRRPQHGASWRGGRHVAITLPRDVARELRSFARKHRLRVRLFPYTTHTLARRYREACESAGIVSAPRLYQLRGALATRALREQPAPKEAAA